MVILIAVSPLPVDHLHLSWNGCCYAEFLTAEFMTPEQLLKIFIYFAMNQG
ncbi:MAG: hypothetical protein KKA54_10455 [Proteobacteria bacterium]|nr:hypothetical protein [Pseudomonadota bacterium]MBU0966785.1 hypothetical protein [Pseudomonadota bacterium]